MDPQPWVERFVNDTAGKQDKPAAKLSRGIDDFGVTSVSVHADQQIVMPGHFRLKFAIDTRYFFGQRNTDTSACDDVFMN